jgi:N-hydroxyarylamine O-acetyltransferase
MDVLHYLKHINVDEGDYVPTLELLQEIHRKHLLKVPFENLDIIFGRKLSMNTEDIYNKIVLDKRGGICFETNTLMYSVLQELGYNVKRISGRFWNIEKSEWNPEFSHLALIISINKTEFLVDVGVGGGFLEPIQIKNGQTYSDANGSYQVVKVVDNEFFLRHLEENEWKDLLQFQTISRNENDFYEQCDYYQTSKETFFTQKRLVSKPTLNGKVTLTDNVLKVTENSQVTITELKDEEEWKRVLQNSFGINIDELAILK